MTSENPFISEKTTLDVTAPSSSPAESIINLQHIRINDDAISGPLVVLFGPSRVGKTVTLLRLCNYIREYEIRAHENFRTDRVEYKKTIETFEALRQDSRFAPDATGHINFLLLDVTYHGNRFCQFLEAPGEHFFNEERPSEPYPAYFNQILNSDYRKVFLFFFELNMFSSDQDRTNYADKIARLAREHIKSRDRVIIVCNKSDLQPYLRGGKPVKSEYKRALYETDAFRKLTKTLSKGGFGRVPFVPFSAGSFTDDGKGKLAFAPSNVQYPKDLWQEIHNCIEGSWWRFLKFW